MTDDEAFMREAIAEADGDVSGGCVLVHEGASSDAGTTAAS